MDILIAADHPDASEDFKVLCKSLRDGCYCGQTAQDL